MSNLKNQSVSIIEESISLIKILQILLKNKNIVLFITLIFSISSFIYVLFIADVIYEVKCKIKPTEPNDEVLINGFSNKLSNLGLFGRKMSSISNDISLVFKSKDFSLLLYNKYQKESRLFYDLLIEVDEEDLSEKEKKEKKIHLGLLHIDEVLAISDNGEFSTKEITVRLKDKYFAYDFILDVKKLLKEYIRKKNILILNDDISFYKEMIESNSNPIVEEELKKMLSKKLNKLFTLSSNVFSVIENPIIPFKKYSPKRLLSIITFTVLGLIIGVFFVFLKKYLKDNGIINSKEDSI